MLEKELDRNNDRKEVKESKKKVSGCSHKWLGPTIADRRAPLVTHVCRKVLSLLVLLWWISCSTSRLSTLEGWCFISFAAGGT